MPIGPLRLGVDPRLTFEPLGLSRLKRILFCSWSFSSREVVPLGVKSGYSFRRGIESVYLVAGESNVFSGRWGSETHEIFVIYLI